MKKYYIYLNGKRYMEMPKEFGIKQDICMNYNDLIDRYFKERNLDARAIPLNRKIEILSEFIRNPQHTDSIIRHELTHIKQMQETPSYSLQYTRASQKYGYKGNPYEVEARQWMHKNIPLHRTGTFDIDYQKQLERWQRKKPTIFESLAKEQRERGKSQTKTKLNKQTKEAVEILKKRLNKFLM